MAKKFCFLFVLILISFSGCATKKMAPLVESRALERPQFPEYKYPERAEGSLWSEVSSLSLYPDRRARRVGDIVTVRIVEDPEAKLSASTKTDRSSSVAGKLKAFGYMQALAERNPRLAQVPGTDDLIKATLTSKFNGKGSSNRDGHIKAFVSAMVLKVHPNGNLLIHGKREIRVNNETQYITLSGIIRAEDISPTNEISSTFVADARITYSGIGPVSDKQKPGWLGRVIDHVWPF